MDWLKKHADAFYVICSIAIGVVWMTNQTIIMKDVITSTEKNLVYRISLLEKDIAVIKASMILKDIIPSELAINEKKALNE